MIFLAIVMIWILGQLSAPTWCYVFLLMWAICKVTFGIIEGWKE